MKKQKCAIYCPNPTLYELKLYRKLKDIGIRSRFEFLEEEELLCLVIPEGKVTIIISGDQWGNTGNKNIRKKVNSGSLMAGDHDLVTIDHGEIRKAVNPVAERIIELVNDCKA